MRSKFESSCCENQPYKWIFHTLLADDRICHVTEVATNKKKGCIFPFSFGGSTFHGCTLFDDDPKPWCSTLVDEEGKHVGERGKWGYCGNECPIDQFGGKLKSVEWPFWKAL